MLAQRGVAFQAREPYRCRKHFPRLRSKSLIPAYSYIINIVMLVVGAYCIRPIKLSPSEKGVCNTLLRTMVINPRPATNPKILIPQNPTPNSNQARVELVLPTNDGTEPMGVAI